MHYKEARLSTNTARLASLVLPRCEIQLRGEIDKKPDLSSLDSNVNELLLLYPDDNATELSPKLAATFTKPITLIVPDGSWRQASKVASRELGHLQVHKVKIPKGAPTQYRLRDEPKAEGLATFEAIARAIGQLESPNAQSQMESLFQLMVDRTLLSRGFKPVTT